VITGRTGPFVQERAVLSRRRLLPTEGEVCLEVGDRVRSDTVVARAPGRGVMRTVNAARLLDVLPGEVPGTMLVAVGERVEAGQVLARTRGLFGLFAMECRAPVSGTVAAVSAHTGRILLEEPSLPLEVHAFLPGVVVELQPGRGATVSGWAARVAGVFGVGGERCGTLAVAVGRPDGELEAARIGAEATGQVLVGGALVTAAALERAAEAGAVGVISGGIHDMELAAWLGRPIVLADTSTTPAPLTLVVTGGFGKVPLDPEAFALLRRHAGREVCLSGWTRVRAGAIRPEVIVPLEEGDGAAPESRMPRLEVGSRVLIVRAPCFGDRGRVGRLPAEARTVESGARCLVAEVDLDRGGTVAVPLCNLEVLA
jgi:hypothetical protein